MGIKLLSSDEKKISFEVENGDMTALRKVMDKWKFADEASAIRFAIATLYITEKGTLYKKEENGSYSLLEPVHKEV